MDIELGAVILEDGPRPVEDWSIVEGIDLHYYHFTGDFTFRVGDVDFSTDEWGWVPIFDFAAALHGIAAALKPGSEELFEFTENEFIIRFRRGADDLVTITAPSYVDGIARVTYSEFLTATTTFLDETAQELLRRHPSLGRNTHFTQLVFGVK